MWKVFQMLEWFLPLFPSWCTNHWYFSGEVGKLSHCYTAYSCCSLAVELRYELSAVGLLERWKFMQVRCRQEQLPVQHCSCLQCWRTEGSVMALTGKLIKLKLSSSETQNSLLVSVEWMLALNAQRFHSSAPLRITCVTMTAALSSGAGRMLEVECQVFSWEEEKGLTGGWGCFPRGISNQFRRRGEKCNLVFCWGGVLASKPFFYLMSRYQSRF